MTINNQYNELPQRLSPHKLSSKINFGMNSDLGLNKSGWRNLPLCGTNRTINQNTKRIMIYTEIYYHIILSEEIRQALL